MCGGRSRMSTYDPCSGGPAQLTSERPAATVRAELLVAVLGLRLLVRLRDGRRHRAVTTHSGTAAPRGATP